MTATGMVIRGDGEGEGDECEGGREAGVTARATVTAIILTLQSR